jgi:uncharacterized alkaline shock family protein YloU
VGKVLDKLLLFLFSLAVAAASAIVILYAFGLLGEFFDWFAWDRLGHSVPHTAWVVIVASLLLIIALRMLYLSLRADHSAPPSIDQRTGYGDVRISLETVENLTLKAASRAKGMRDLKARVNVSEAGIELAIRAVVEGDVPIPDLSEEVQRMVKEHVEEITGIPVSLVSVYIANVASSTSFRSRVE